MGAAGRGERRARVLRPADRGVPGMKPRTLWSAAGSNIDALMLSYTVGDDRHWDARLLPWDVLGSLGHIEGLRASQLLSPPEYRRLRTGLRAGFAAVRQGRLRIDPRHEDVH